MINNLSTNMSSVDGPDQDIKVAVGSILPFDLEEDYWNLLLLLENYLAFPNIWNKVQVVSYKSYGGKFNEVLCPKKENSIYIRMVNESLCRIVA